MRTFGLRAGDRRFRDRASTPHGGTAMSSQAGLPWCCREGDGVALSVMGCSRRGRKGHRRQHGGDFAEGRQGRGREGERTDTPTHTRTTICRQASHQERQRTPSTSVSRDVLSWAVARSPTRQRKDDFGAERETPCSPCNSRTRTRGRLAGAVRRFPPLWRCPRRANTKEPGAA